MEHKKIRQAVIRNRCVVCNGNYAILYFVLFGVEIFRT